VGWFYLWTAMQPAGSWVISTPEPRGYYPLQTAGFRSGHLYASIAPRPELLALKDPYDPGPNAAYRVHDMSLRGGRYYLYFGVTPVLLLFWPVAAATGRYLSEPFAVALFASAAIWTGMGLLLAIRRRHFPLAPFPALLLAWLCLAWATPLSLLVEGPRVYEVPIACAAFLQALMLACLYRALHSPARALAWMGAAGLVCGLLVGARPNQASCAAALLVGVAFLARPYPSGKAGLAARALFWTFLPAALCGCGLLWYNWVRFGSPSEFGIHFQLAAERVSDLKLMDLRFLVPHAAFYLLNPGHWDSYFPFFSAQDGQPYGILRYVPWTWLGALAFLAPGRSKPGDKGGRAGIACALACAFLASLALLSCFEGTTYRYPADFANMALILAGMGALALAERARAAGRWGPTASALAAIAAVSLFFGMASYFGFFSGTDGFLRLARAANGPAYAWERARGENFGGLRLEVRLPERPPGLAEPIIETGSQVDRRDWLEILYLQGGRARLDFRHGSSTSLEGHSFKVPEGRDVTIEARFGSLLPPFGHPLFSDWPRPEYDVARRNLRITVDGAEVLRAQLSCFGASPASTRVGFLDWSADGTLQRFSGSIVRSERLPLLRPARYAPAAAGPQGVELSLLLPASTRPGADPLLATGRGRQSDLLYCAYDGEGCVSFGLDHFGVGERRSPPVAYDPLIPHTVGVWMGSFAGPPGSPPAESGESDRLVVDVDGHAVLNVHQSFYPGSSEAPVVGVNPYASGMAGPVYTGETLAVRRVSKGSLPGLLMGGKYGSIELTVTFPAGVTGTQEPLAVTGRAGAGDFVYVRYVDKSHVAFGFDHWGAGGLVGMPVEVDYRQPHSLSITFQSLFPPGSLRRDSGALKVLMDGLPVLAGEFSCFPSLAAEVRVAENPIGGSTCGPAFTGNILGVEQIGERRE
jgi:hypothetical protein